MLSVKAVIGANYGDEGKGQVAFSLASSSPLREKDTVVVLTNGGCQRGHTVTFEDKRHVFHHFGCGTFCSVASYFSKFFILNAMQFIKEYEELKEYNPITYRDSRCRWSTPWDIFVNRYTESYLESHGGRHGSVGMGIWETVNRYEKQEETIGIKPLSFNDFCSLTLEDKIEYIKTIEYTWISNRIKEIKEQYSLADDFLEYKESELFNIFTEESFIEHFCNDMNLMNTLCPERDFEKLTKKLNYVIFENAQGLLLNQGESSDDKHFTPSVTGIGVVNDLLSELDNEFSIEVYYVSRTYLTRHGNGPFPEEFTDGTTYEDDTNITNEWQGSIRFGKLNAKELRERCKNDLKNLSYKSLAFIVFTHNDQYSYKNYDIYDEFRMCTMHSFYFSKKDYMMIWI